MLRDNTTFWRFLVGFFFQTTAGTMLATMLALGLAARGVEAALIGALATVWSVAYIVTLPVAPGIIARFGQETTFRFAMLLGALAVLGLTLSEAPALIAVLYGLLGLSAGLRFTIAESWVPTLVRAQERGRALALYQTAVGASAFVGSGLLLLTGIDGLVPRLVAVGAVLTGVMILWPVSAPAGEPTELAAPTPRTRLGRVALQVGPLVLVAALLGGLYESGLAVALPLFGLEVGGGATLATGLATAMGLGSLLQYPFGALADRFAWRNVVIGAAAVIAGSAILLPLAPYWPWLLPGLGVIWGSAGGGLYTLATIRNSALWRGPHLVGASVVTQFAYMIGEAIGPASGGVALDLSPLYGLPILVAGTGAVGLALILSAGRASSPNVVVGPVQAEAV